MGLSCRDRVAWMVMLLGVTMAGCSYVQADGPDSLRMYVGTYTRGESEGIYTAEFDPATGEVRGLKLAGEAQNPSFLTVHPNGRWLYAVREVGDFGEGGTGAVAAYAIDPETHELTRLNEVASGGVAPCHVIVDRAERHVLAANYGGGSAGAWRIEDDGSLGERTAFVEHEGSGEHPQRQQRPHAHAVELDAAGRHLFVPDLGANRVFGYRYDDEAGTLAANDAVRMEPGAGPRHMRFAPSGERAYVINELTSTLTAMSYDAEAGQLEPMQTVSTLPEGFEGNNSTAEVAVHPSGRFVYGSNRGHDSIAVFRVDEQTGELEAAGHVKTGGSTPRHFAIDPTGRWLIVANQESNSLVVFAIDPETGMPEPTGQTVEAPAPVCIKFMPG